MLLCMIKWEPLRKQKRGIMSIGEILLLSVALASDAFAVSICKGLSSRKEYIKTGLVCGLWFGVFQALMPFLGWLLGSTVSGHVSRFSAYIAFALLAFLGGKMIFEAVKEKREECLLSDSEKMEEEKKNASLSFRVMLAFAIATSIDALAAGLTFAVCEVNILLATSFIGIITFICSFIGAAVGAKIGCRFKDKAQIAGGIILIAIGFKILLEHIITFF